MSSAHRYMKTFCKSCQKVINRLQVGRLPHLCLGCWSKELPEPRFHHMVLEKARRKLAERREAV
jgi:hypothetical protein